MTPFKTEMYVVSQMSSTENKFNCAQEIIKTKKGKALTPSCSDSFISFIEVKFRK